MSERAIYNTAKALQRRLETVLGAGTVHIGTPESNEVGQAAASILLYHVGVNAALRNETRRHRDDPTARWSDALPLDLRFLITVLRSDNEELNDLGKIVAELQRDPMLSGPSLDDQVVRVTPEPESMEDLYRIWDLFPQDGYRPSIVYLATPVFIEAREVPAGPPVERHEQKAGVDDRSLAQRREAEEPNVA